MGEGVECPHGRRMKTANRVLLVDLKINQSMNQSIITAPKGQEILIV